LHSINDENEELEMALKKFRKDRPRRTRSLAEYITADEIVFSKEGLALNVQNDAFEGLFVPIEAFVWKNQPGADTDDGASWVTEGSPARDV
jgi:hypothetical protein